MNLAGVWYGRYDGTTDVASNRFIALLTDDDGALGGSISEPDDLGSAALRRAFVRGRRGGRAVRFVKQYDGAILAHAVDYDGVVDETATVISGRWSFAAYAGTFVMERDEPLAEQARRYAQEEEPVG